MKNIYNTMLLITGILFMSNSSCKKETINGIKNADYNQIFELELNGKVILPKNNSDLMIEFTQINDSRCPSDAQCIWAGNAIVSLKFESQTNAVVTETLCLGQCDKQFQASDTAIVNLNNINYTVILKEVNPYPNTNKPASKTAVLMVQKN